MAVLKKRKLVVAESVYIDPENCDSTVSYKIVHGQRGTWGSVHLTDCSRKIEWFFGVPSKSALAKADKAITTLQDVRAALANAFESIPKKPLLKGKK